MTGLRKSFAVLAVLVAGVTMGAEANAGSITSPVNGGILSGAPGFGDIADTYNRNGLLTPFTSGVTDFDTYVGSNPLHSFVFSGNEWFSEQDPSASVSYDMGSSVSMSALALWNEEAAGIPSLALFTSDDGTSWTAWASGITPTDHPIEADYGVDVIALSTRTARYVRLDMTECPLSGAGGCGIGEVAFDVVTDTPEPASIALLAAGLLGLAARRRAA